MIKKIAKAKLVFAYAIIILTVIGISIYLLTITSGDLFKNQSTKNFALVSVKLIDADSAKPITDIDVNLYSDNNVRCVTTPCDTNDQKWTGKSDQNGVITISSNFMKLSTTITATGYRSGRDIIKDSEKIDENNLIIELDPDSRIDKSERRIKLIDSETQKPLAKETISITDSEDCNPIDCPNVNFSEVTNPLGNVYVPMSSVENDSWIFVENYIAVKFPSGWVNYRVIMREK